VLGGSGAEILLALDLLEASEHLRLRCTVSGLEREKLLELVVHRRIPLFASSARRRVGMALIVFTQTTKTCPHMRIFFSCEITVSIRQYCRSKNERNMRKIDA
jgi:hypothetical protein